MALDVLFNYRKREKIYTKKEFINVELMFFFFFFEKLSCLKCVEFLGDRKG